MNKKKKILFVEYCADLKAGGAQRVFLNILNSFDCNTYSIFAAFPKVPDGAMAAEVPDHVGQLSYDSKSPDGSHNKLWAYFIFALFIPIIVLRWCRVIKRDKIEVVYVHSIISGFHFSLVKCFVNFKLIYHEHNMASQRPNMILWRWLFDFVAYKSDRVIAISKSVAESLKDFGVAEEKIAVIHNGIDLTVNEAREELRIRGLKRLKVDSKDSALLVGMVGHFRPWKGQQLFIESLPTVLKADQNIHYVLVGGVQDQAYYQSTLDYIVEHDLAEKVTITGHQDDTLELIACLDVVVVPSVPEPSGLVQLESMMMHKPVVAFNMGGPTEIVQHRETGLLVSEVSASALGLAIAELAVCRELRERLGRQGRRRVEDYFTNRAQIKQIEQLVADI